MAQAYLVTGQQRYLLASREAADVVWQRGLVRKVGLCHGIAGNIYVFLALRRAEQHALRLGHAQASEQRPERALHRARAFGSFLILGPTLAGASPSLSLTTTTTTTSRDVNASSSAGAGSSSSADPSPSHAYWRRLVTSGEMHGGDRGASLFEGAAGVAYALEDLLHPDTARFPGYEL